jgi:1-acyl-sn-glycerol-3-phosphate acyltransferase
VADAEVIPIGGRGRPGRGSRTSPSAAARALAPSKGRAERPRRVTDESVESVESAEPDVQPVDPTTPAAPAEEAAESPTKPTRRTTAKKKSATTKGRAKKAAPRAESAPSGRSTAADAGPSAASPVIDESTASEQPAMAAEDVADAIVDAAHEVFGAEGWERRLAEMLAFVRRRVTGDYEVDEFGFDIEVTETFLLTALRPLAEKWFRIEVHGIDNIPTEGGALVVSNHSGTVPIDGMMTGLVIHDHADRYLRMLGADLVFRLPFVGEMARKGGATLASNEDAERMLSRGDLVGVWPEGFKGIGKPFSERYKLQRFGRGGFVSAALRTGVPIVPCSVVGAEEIYPLVGNIPSLARLLGVPYIPITPFFPWLGPLGMIPLPSKWLIEFGEPIRTDTYGDGAADDPMLVFNVTDQVRETIQQTLYALLIQRRSVFS